MADVVRLLIMVVAPEVVAVTSVHANTGVIAGINYSENGYPGHHRPSASYMYAPTLSNRNCKVGGDACGYMLSNSKLYAPIENTSVPLNEYIGVSSWTINMEAPANANNATNSNWNYTQDRTIYTSTKPYADHSKGAYSMYGKENTPEYFACLPLIKI